MSDDEFTKALVERMRDFARSLYPDETDEQIQVRVDEAIRADAELRRKREDKP